MACLFYIGTIGMPSWGDLLSELQDHIDSNGQTVRALSLDDLRNDYILELNNYTKRNVIAYYSEWQKPGKHRISILMIAILLGL